MAGAAASPHVLVFPIPLQGHLPPALKLAEVLSLQGLLVTVLTTDNAHDRIRRSGGVDALLSRRPGLRLRSIPDGLPVDHPRAVGQFREVLDALASRSSREGLRDLLASLGEEHDGRPPVTCAIMDGILPSAGEVAEELGMPVISYRGGGPCSFWAYFCIPKLIEEGEVPFPEGCDMDELVRGVPGMESFLRRRDLPSYCRTKDQNDPSLLATASATQWSPRARGLIFNTVEPLDAALLAQIRSRCPVTYTVGPFHSLLQQLDAENTTDGTAAASSTPAAASASPGLWREDCTCIAWLDTQSHHSVVYVSFGSLAVLSTAQLLEIWHGLVNSGHRFLWVIRPDLLEEMGKAVDIPAEVTEVAKEKGCIVGWAPQQEVLTHPAVGAFLTHSGWNSTLESISAGVPMICWPFFLDQTVNSRLVSEVWRVGVDMKDTCDRDTVERVVREVMEGDKAEELRRNAAGLAKIVRDGVAEGGSSRINLERLVQDITSMSREQHRN